MALILMAFMALKVAFADLQFNALVQHKFCDSFKGSAWAAVYRLKEANSCFDSLCYPDEVKHFLYNQFNKKKLDRFILCVIS